MKETFLFISILLISSLFYKDETIHFHVMIVILSAISCVQLDNLMIKCLLLKIIVFFKKDNRVIMQIDSELYGCDILNKFEKRTLKNGYYTLGKNLNLEAIENFFSNRKDFAEAIEGLVQQGNCNLLFKKKVMSVWSMFHCLGDYNLCFEFSKAALKSSEGTPIANDYRLIHGYLTFLKEKNVSFELSGVKLTMRRLPHGIELSLTNGNRVIERQGLVADGKVGFLVFKKLFLTTAGNLPVIVGNYRNKLFKFYQGMGMDDLCNPDVSLFLNNPVNAEVYIHGRNKPQTWVEISSIFAIFIFYTFISNITNHSYFMILFVILFSKLSRLNFFYFKLSLFNAVGKMFGVQTGKRLYFKLCNLITVFNFCCGTEPIPAYNVIAFRDVYTLKSMIKCDTFIRADFQKHRCKLESTYMSDKLEYDRVGETVKIFGPSRKIKFESELTNDQIDLLIDIIDKVNKGNSQGLCNGSNRVFGQVYLHLINVEEIIKEIRVKSHVGFNTWIAPRGNVKCGSYTENVDKTIYDNLREFGWSGCKGSEIAALSYYVREFITSCGGNYKEFLDKIPLYGVVNKKWFPNLSNKKMKLFTSDISRLVLKLKGKPLYKIDIQPPSESLKKTMSMMETEGFKLNLISDSNELMKPYLKYEIKQVEIEESTNLSKNEGPTEVIGSGAGEGKTGLSDTDIPNRESELSTVKISESNVVDVFIDNANKLKTLIDTCMDKSPTGALELKPWAKGHFEAYKRDFEIKGNSKERKRQESLLFQDWKEKVGSNWPELLKKPVGLLGKNELINELALICTFSFRTIDVRFYIKDFLKGGEIRLNKKSEKPLLILKDRPSKPVHNNQKIIVLTEYVEIEEVKVKDAKVEKLNESGFINLKEVFNKASIMNPGKRKRRPHDPKVVKSKKNRFQRKKTTVPINYILKKFGCKFKHKLILTRNSIEMRKVESSLFKRMSVVVNNILTTKIETRLKLNKELNTGNSTAGGSEVDPEEPQHIKDIRNMIEEFANDLNKVNKACL